MYMCIGVIEDGCLMIEEVSGVVRLEVNLHQVLLITAYVVTPRCDSSTVIYIPI